MGILIVGCGSIGRRHAKNAASLGKELILFDINKKLTESLAKETSACIVDNLDDGLKQKPEAAFICTPPNLHIEQAIKCAKEGVPLFIEKPLSSSLENVDNLIEEIEKRQLPNMVACNLRFDDGLKMIKKKLVCLEDLVFAKIEFGYDLRKWRPQQNYKCNYACSKSQGGGIVLDSIHELDYACWLFGKLIDGQSKVTNSGVLNIETEDCAEFLLKFEHCPIVNLHLDYLQPEYTRKLKILGSNGMLKWDFYTKKVEYNIKGMKKELQTSKDVNKMYANEIEYFLLEVLNKKSQTNTVKEAAKTLKIALKLREEGNYI